MTGFRNFSVLDRRENGAALLLDMGAAGEFTLTDVRLELRKRILQILGQNQIHLLSLKRGEAGRVRDVAAAFDRV